MSEVVLKKLAQQLNELEELGLEYSDEYEEILSDYHEHSMSLLPSFSNGEERYILYVNYFDQAEAKYDEYETYDEAEEIGIELVDGGTVENYKICEDY